MSESNAVFVKESPIEGRGVFAARDLKKGEIVLQWDLTHPLSQEEMMRLPDQEKRYVTFLGGKYILMQPPSRYVNHSCTPNTTAKDFCDVAIRDIRKGEEITGDYSENEIPGKSMLCKCSSKNCRGIIGR